MHSTIRDTVICFCPKDITTKDILNFYRRMMHISHILHFKGHHVCGVYGIDVKMYLPLCLWMHTVWYQKATKSRIWNLCGTSDSTIWEWMFLFYFFQFDTINCGYVVLSSVNFVYKIIKANYNLSYWWNKTFYVFDKARCSARFYSVWQYTPWNIMATTSNVKHFYDYNENMYWNKMTEFA